MEVVPTSITGIDDLISITSEALDAGPDYDMDGDKGNDLAAYEAKTNDIIATINAIVDSKDIVPKDLKFDDSIMPQAPNYYEWVIDANFLGSDMPPYLEQALIGIKLFAEYCPECSDLGWMDDNGHKPTDGLATFELKVTLLEYGVCPKCGARRSQLMKEGKLNFYNELAVNAGQRCVTADTLVLTTSGMKRIGDYDDDRPYGFSPLVETIHNGDAPEDTALFYKAKPEILNKVTLQNGISIKGTNDHPIYTLSGFKRLEDVADSDWVKVKYGQGMFGKTILSASDLKAYSKKVFDRKLKTTNVNNKHQLKNTNIKSNKGPVCEDLYTVLGLWVAEGRGTHISNTDKEVLDFVEATLNKYINARYIKRNKDGIKIIGYRGKAWLAKALGIKVKELLSGSAAKCIPSTVLEAPKQYVVAFLKGLYEGDGTNRDGIHSVKYTTISRRLARELQTVLHNIGIPCKQSTFNTWATNGTLKQVAKTGYTVSIRGQFVKVFQDEVGFLTVRKKSELAEDVKSYDGRSVKQTFIHDRLPTDLKHDVYNFVRSTIVPQLNQLKTKNVVYKGRTLGMQTLFGHSGSKIGFKFGSIVKRELPLTKCKLAKIIECLKEYSWAYSQEVLSKVTYWESFLRDDEYWVKVGANVKSDKAIATYDFNIPGTHRFVANAIVNHNSGKSALVAMLSTYITHRMLKAQKPSQIFDVKSNTLFHGTFVALTFAQAKDSLWDPYYIYLLESPWFKAYHALLRKYERKFNTEIFKLKDTFVQYRHRQLMVYPAGPDTRTLRGRTRIFGAIDELGWFDNEKDSTKVKMNASGVYAAMGNSFRTVRTSETRQIAMGYDEALTGYFMNVSSPSSQRDKICELVRQSKHSKKLLGLHKPTWEMNPNITRESLQEDYDRDPIVAERDFGAAPPLSASPFINNKESIINCMKTRGRNFVTYNFYTYKSSEGKHFRYAIVDNIKASDTRSCLAFDAGLTNNSFSIACGSLQTWEVQGRELEIPCMDLLVEINPAPGVPLHYTKIFDGVLNPIIEKRNVSVFLADRWNSTKILQDAEMMHESVEVARQYSLKYVDMGNTKRALEDEEFRIPRSSNEKFDFEKDILQFNHMSYPKCFEHRPVEHLILQLVTVQDTGKTVLKGDGLTDDLWRATSLCHWGLIQDEYQDFLSKPVSMTQKKGALGISKLGSGSAAGVSSGSKGQVAGSVRTRGRN